MKTGDFARLYRWELRQTVRSPLLWVIMAILGGALLWAALDTAAFHRAQTVAQEKTLQAQAAHDANLRARRQAYAAPAGPDAPAIPYWQDPTGISGFSQYFIFKHAMKPHLPLSPLAAGVSDIAPSRVPIKLNTVFGFDEGYDFENPRGLSLGRFDMAFVLAVLLPLSLILIFGLMGSFERDRGMMRLIAAQSASPRSWMASRLAAILTCVMPVAVLELLVALLAAGALPGAALSELLAAILLLVGYILFWSGICALVLSRLPGSAQALGQLTAVWTILVVGLPLFLSLAAALLDPAPAGVGYVDALRRTSDAVQKESVRIVRDGFAADPRLSGEIPLTGQMDHATRLTFLTPEMERRLQPLQQAARDYRARQDSLSRVAGFAVPVLGLQEALADLAGTGRARQDSFLDQARAYQLRLRAIVYPLVQREAVSPSPQRVPPARGRLNAPEGDFLPGFAMWDGSAEERTQPALLFALWTGFLGLGLGVVALRATRRWPL